MFFTLSPACFFLKLIFITFKLHIKFRLSLFNQHLETLRKFLCTYKSVLVRDVVGQFEFMESNRLGHPLLASGRAVRVDVHPLGHLRVGLACHHPAGVVELVAAVVRGHDVQQQDVFGFFIQPVYPHLERREHPPGETKTQHTVSAEIQTKQVRR